MLPDEMDYMSTEEMIGQTAMQRVFVGRMSVKEARAYAAAWGEALGEIRALPTTTDNRF